MDSKTLYLYIAVMCNLIMVVEKMGLTLFLFPHLVDDISRETAQRNFATSQIVYWLLSMVLNVAASAFVDKTGYSHATMVFCVVCKILYSCIYVSSDSVNLFMGCMVLAALSSSLFPLSIAEIDKYSDEYSTNGEHNQWLNRAILLQSVGGVLSGIMRLTPTGTKIDMRILTITQGTICMFILASICLIYLPFLVFARPSDLYKREKDIITPYDNIAYIGNRKLKIFAICANIFGMSMLWEISTITIIEVDKHIEASRYIVAIYFVVRYCVAGMSSKVWPRILNRYKSAALMAYVVTRETAAVIMFISSIVPSNLTAFWLLLIANMILSILYFYDQSVMFAELWTLSEDVTTVTSLGVVAEKAGYLFAFIVPLCFNFIEIVYAITLTILVAIQILLMKTSVL